MLAEF